MPILTLVSLAATLVLSDRTFDDLKPAVTADTLTCVPARPDAAFPVNGDLELRLPDLNAYTALTHFPQVGQNTAAESCAGVTALLEEARQAGGALKAKARVVMTRAQVIDSQNVCNLTLTETVTLTFVSRVPFRGLTNVRVLDLGQCPTKTK